MSIAVEAPSDQHADAVAKKLDELLKTAAARMMIQSEGIQLSGDGAPVVHQPQREVA